MAVNGRVILWLEAGRDKDRWEYRDVYKIMKIETLPDSKPI